MCLAFERDVSLLQADDYVLERKSKYKAMLLNNVVMGKTIKLMKSDGSLTEVVLCHSSVLPILTPGLLLLATPWLRRRCR